MARPEIKALDRALAKDGETVTLRRRVGTGSVFIEVQCRARLAGYRAENIIGVVKVTDSQFIMSPTQIAAAVAAGTWPGAAGGDIWPKIGDFIRQAGGIDRRIEQTKPVTVGDEVVRIDGRILG